MYDETFIMQFMPKLKYLAEKYANEEYDTNDLISEGQIYLLEYLKAKQNINKDNLAHLAYCSVDKRLKTFTSHKVDYIEPLTDNMVTIFNGYVFDSDELFNLVKEVLTDREFTIIALYYGIITNKKSMNDIAKMLNLSINRISQLRIIAERKIKKKLRQYGIRSLSDLYF